MPQTLRRIFKALLQEEGQDLIEYAMIVALVAFAAAAGMQSAAGGVNNVFLKVGAIIAGATTG